MVVVVVVVVETAVQQEQARGGQVGEAGSVPPHWYGGTIPIGGEIGGEHATAAAAAVEEEEAQHALRRGGELRLHKKRGCRSALPNRLDGGAPAGCGCCSCCAGGQLGCDCSRAVICCCCCCCIASRSSSAQP